MAQVRPATLSSPRTYSIPGLRARSKSGKWLDSDRAAPRPLQRAISFREVSAALAQRSRQRQYNFWLKCWASLISIVGNVASPIKSYVLSFYGLPGDDLVFSHNLNWTMQVDYAYARALYDQSGINYTAPLHEPIRFINMYQDFRRL